MAKRSPSAWEQERDAAVLQDAAQQQIETRAQSKKMLSPKSTASEAAVEVTPAMQREASSPSRSYMRSSRPD